MSKSTITMDDLLNDQPIKALNLEDVVEGIIIAKDRRELWLDLGAYGTGVVSGKELEHTAKDLQVGDVVSASVIDIENDEGQVEIGRAHV